MNEYHEGCLIPIEYATILKKIRSSYNRWCNMVFILRYIDRSLYFGGMDMSRLFIDEEKLSTSIAAPNHVCIEEMPSYLIQAFIAIEDHRFYQHIGIDPIALGRALLVDLKKRSSIQGGSTITMQLSRNLFLNHEKTYKRKIKEMLIAIYLETRFSKKQIIEMYLNNIYFGHGKYGIEVAADLYFNKTVSLHHPTKEVVSLAEAAILAALPKAPERYSPIKSLSKARKRQHIVLNRMEQLGMITDVEKKTALEEKLQIVGKGDRSCA